MGRQRVEPGHESVWDYPRPPRLEDCIAFYPSRKDACWVGVEKVRVQEGVFYGGWIPPTSLALSRAARAPGAGR